MFTYTKPCLCMANRYIFDIIGMTVIAMDIDRLEVTFNDALYLRVTFIEILMEMALFVEFFLASVFSWNVFLLWKNNFLWKIHFQSNYV